MILDGAATEDKATDPHTIEPVVVAESVHDIAQVRDQEPVIEPAPRRGFGSFLRLGIHENWRK